MLCIVTGGICSMCVILPFHRSINLYFESENVNSPISYHGDPPRYKSHSHGSRHTSLPVIVWAGWCLRTTLVSRRYVDCFISQPGSLLSDAKYYHTKCWTPLDNAALQTDDRPIRSTQTTKRLLGTIQKRKDLWKRVGRIRRCSVCLLFPIMKCPTYLETGMK